ncbi:hypothetical protein [Trichlorobacter ammonificans]|uniref:Porin n=1 Tax=Trichlorobacter ammonificans TaxID=2916410 RepID=A0ABM9D9V5_9BACT|nr:hypothetical protein [Trichlorobacter ammonificans]CAH2031376.1 conserved protein of unknown function [Trichlorobacter ammonificans]
MEKLSETAARYLVILALAQLSASPVRADELFGLGGAVVSRQAIRNGSSGSWQVEYRHNLAPSLAVGLTYLNEGHMPDHHRDGHSLQFWGSRAIGGSRLSLSAGAGPYYYYDTVTGTGSDGHRNEHGFGCLLSLAAVLRTDSPWLFQVRANWAETFGKMDTASLLAGIGYQTDHPARAASSLAERSKATDRELFLLAGSTFTNSFDVAHSAALSLEYRQRFARNLAMSLAWLYEGENRLIRRYGPTLQLWAVTDALDGEVTLGLAAGAYAAFDEQAGMNRRGDWIVTPIATMAADYRLDQRWSLRFSWSRVVTDYDRDSDVLLGGVGYRF